MCDATESHREKSRTAGTSSTRGLAQGRAFAAFNGADVPATAGAAASDMRAGGQMGRNVRQGTGVLINDSRSWDYHLVLRRDAQAICARKPLRQ